MTGNWTAFIKFVVAYLVFLRDLDVGDLLRTDGGLSEVLGYVLLILSFSFGLVFWSCWLCLLLRRGWGVDSSALVPCLEALRGLEQAGGLSLALAASAQLWPCSHLRFLPSISHSHHTALTSIPEKPIPP